MNKTERLLNKNSFAITRGHDFVEIDGVKWATCNLGAENPEDPGLYFMWGDTKGYPSIRLMDFNEHPHYIGIINNMWAKYNRSDGEKILELEDDPAHVLWGGKWRTPTIDEFRKLDDFFYRNRGDSDTKILFPECNYWTSEKTNVDYCPEAAFVYKRSRQFVMFDTKGRYKLCCIRPVLDV